MKINTKAAIINLSVDRCMASKSFKANFMTGNADAHRKIVKLKATTIDIFKPFIMK